MIHTLLNLTRSLFILDCETTGTDPRVDRIVELGFQRWTAEGMVKEWRSLVNPGILIPPSATKVHGITDAQVTIGCRRCGKDVNEHPNDVCTEWAVVPRFRDLAPNLVTGLTSCDFAGKNIRFDLRILAAEFARVKVPWDYVGAYIICADRLEQLAEPRSLSHLHKKYAGREHDGAHGALSDVRASATVIAGQLSRYETLPRQLAALHDAQWPGWLCDSGQFKMVNGVPTCTFGKYKDRSMREVPVDYYDWILQGDFPADVKALARDAKLGKFPGA